MYMNTTSLHIQIDTDIKEQAQQTADELGLSLSAVTKALLKQFIRTKQLSVGLTEIPNEHLKLSLKRSEKDIKAGKTLSFKDGEAALDYVDSLIKHDEQKQ
jgi:addiction module RelB/DinJ family antitoxin